MSRFVTGWRHVAKHTRGSRMILKEQATLDEAVATADALTQGWSAWACAVQTGIKARPVFYVADREGLEQLHQWGQKNIEVQYERGARTVTLVDGRRLPVISEAYWAQKMGLGKRLPALTRPLVRDDRQKNSPVVGWWEFAFSNGTDLTPNGFDSMMTELTWRVCYVGLPSDSKLAGAVYVRTKWVARKDGFIAYSQVSARDAARNVRNQVRRHMRATQQVTIVGS